MPLPFLVQLPQVLGSQANEWQVRVCAALGPRFCQSSGAAAERQGSGPPGGGGRGTGRQTPLSPAGSGRPGRCSDAPQGSLTQSLSSPLRPATPRLFPSAAVGPPKLHQGALGLSNSSCLLRILREAQVEKLGAALPQKPQYYGCAKPHPSQRPAPRAWLRDAQLLPELGVRARRLCALRSQPSQMHRDASPQGLSAAAFLSFLSTLHLPGRELTGQRARVPGEEMHCTRSLTFAWRLHRLPDLSQHDLSDKAGEVPTWSQEGSDAAS